MSRPYFRQIPNVDYISRGADKKNISDYITVKNLFKRGKIREEISENLTFFDKYKILGDERPDNVAYNVYQDATLDWVVLLSNNILHPYIGTNRETYIKTFSYNILYAVIAREPCNPIFPPAE